MKKEEPQKNNNITMYALNVLGEKLTRDLVLFCKFFSDIKQASILNDQK